MERTFPVVSPRMDPAALSEQAATLLARDFLYDDPASYRAGIMAVLALAAAPVSASSATA